MAKPNFPSIRGFENFPKGKLLDQRVDFSTEVGIAYERCIGYEKPAHNHDRFTITFPRGASRSFIRLISEKETFRLDQSWVHLMPAGAEHEQGSFSAVYDTFALFPNKKVVEKALDRMSLSAKDRNEFLKIGKRVKRTPLLDDLINRYFFSRVVSREKSNHEQKFLEDEILNLVISLSLKLKVVSDGMKKLSEGEGSTGIDRALEYIESNLFQNLDTSMIVAYSKTSQASLFRLFKKALGQSPFEYIRNRRLDEAAQLLKTGNYLVSDVALLVCYEDLSAFSKAFKLHFKKSPSEFLPAPSR